MDFIPVAADHGFHIEESQLIYRLEPEDLRFKGAEVVDSSMTIVLCEAVDLIHVFADIALICP